MKFFSNLRIRLEKDIITRIYRSLGGNSKINVKIGQEVTPDEIIGTSEISSGFRTINLAESLSAPAKEVEKYLKKQIGQKIYKDELLAYKKGGFLAGEHVIIAPTDGILEHLNPQTGELKITFLTKKMELPAGVYGIVEYIDNARGLIIISTQVSRIYGMFGSGKKRDGILKKVGKREDLLGKSAISVKENGNILFGGSLVFKEALSAAISAGVNGMISGGINAKDYRGMAGGRLVFPHKLETDVGISVVICEGFGSIPLGEDIYEVLSSYEGRFVSMDGNKGLVYLPSFESSSLVKVRNTKLPPIENALAEGYEMKEGIVELKPGLQVRVRGNSFAGESGRVLTIDQSETLLPSGIKAYLVTIETPRRKIKVPVANIEVISGA